MSRSRWKNRKEKGHLAVRSAVWLGIVLLLGVMVLAAYLEVADTTKIAADTIATMKRQCIRFNKLVVADRTKSLFRLTDMMRDFSVRLESGSIRADDASLEEYVDSMRITGVAVLDGNLKLEASGYTRQFSNETWDITPGGNRYTDILEYPSKVFAERVEINEEYYDVCAVARKDAPGIIVGFYHQPSGLIAGTENDLESMLTGLHLERDGRYAIVENGHVRVSSDEAVKDRDVSESAILEQLSQIPKDGALHLFYVNGKHYWGYRSGCEGYGLFIYYPVISLVSISFIVVAAFAVIYFVLCGIYFAVRGRILQKNQEELRESNKTLTETVEMLRALETIYFTLFYVDLEHDSYRTVYMAPWLKTSVPEKGVYTELKQLFLDTMVLPAYQDEINRKMSIEYILENLNRANISEVRKSFYTDYQASRGGEIRWCRVSVTVVDYSDAGEPVHVLALLQDVNREKVKEAEYQERILEEAYAARVANGAKTEFLRRISHDIRTPINGIQGYLSQAASHPEDRALQVYCMENANRALRTLMELVNSVLDMSKLESSEIILEKKPFDLNVMLREVNVILQPQAMARNISYEITRKEALPFPHLVGSPRHVSQILMNLVSNAVKYGKPGGYVRMNTRLICAAEQEVTYEFTCEDNGIGMGREFQQHMYEPFTQEAETVSARTVYEGSGLGLSIVKKLVDALGGTIFCDSQENVGTTFRVQLSFQIDREYKEMPDGADMPDGSVLKGKHILLVEDNELNMEVASFLLSECGADVTEAWNGQEGVQFFAASEPGYYDVVIMDIMMPVMNGYEAASAIRALDRPDAGVVPICAMSANAFTDDIQKSLEAGMNEHIPKPVDRQNFLAVMEKLLGK